MRSIKNLLEKPLFIWTVVALSYAAGFWFWGRSQAPDALESRTYDVIQTFSQTSFPPQIGVIRELKDWGHVGYYSIVGQLSAMVKGDLTKLRAAHLLIVLLTFFIFVKLGVYFTTRNRLSPLWVSVALLLLAVSPYQWQGAFFLSTAPFLLFFSLFGLACFIHDKLGWAAILTSIAALIDWSGLLLPIAFIFTRLSEVRGRVVRPVRLVYFTLPLLVAALPLMAWQGFLPQGEARSWLTDYRSRANVFRLDNLTYALAIFPLYTIWFSWAWGIKARTRALIVGAIVTCIALPLFFVSPISADLWELARSGLDLTRGLVDALAVNVAGEYKNFLLFIPYLAGVFLLSQLAMMDVLDRSRCLQFLIFLFFAVQPLAISSGDRSFSFIVPFILLISLSEAMVGEQGNLSKI